MPITVPPTISAVPAFPAMADRATGTYNSKAYTWATHMSATYGPELAALANNVYANAGDAHTSALAAADSESAAAVAAVTAGGHATNLASLNALWLGAAATNPTTGKAGAPLVAGNAYVNTVSGLLMAYNGSAWVQGISAVAGVSSVNGMTGVVTLQTLPRYAYDNRSTLRSLTPANGDAAVVDGLGLFAWESGSTEPDDDESCFATAGGCWLLQAASWDLLDAWQAPDDSARDADDEDEPARFAERFAERFAARVLRTTYSSTVTSVVANSRTTQTVVVPGAVLGAHVFVTRSAAASGSADGLVIAAVTATDTVTVTYCGGDYTTTYFAAGTWGLCVINP